MANPPPPVSKKGWGCCGCGCVILVLLVILALGLVGGISYLGYTNTLKVTSEAPAKIPTFDGGDDVYGTTLQKLKSFNHDVQNHVGATIHLTADEINTMIAREPNFAKNNIRAFVTINDNQARIQFSLPTGGLTDGYVKDRYLNGNGSFTMSFDPDSKKISIIFKSLEVGPIVVPQENLNSLQNITDPALNSLLQQDASCKAFLDQTNSIQIKNNEIEIETK